VGGKLLEQLEIGKAKPDSLYPAKDLMPARLWDLFGFVQNKLIRVNQLHRILCLG
jgi:hypothetical protein